MLINTYRRFPKFLLYFRWVTFARRCFRDVNRVFVKLVDTKQRHKLIFVELADNLNRHTISNEFDFRLDQTIHFGVNYH